MGKQDFRYTAFISYSHADEHIAVDLHRALERYRVPANVARDSRGSLRPVFLDTEELASAPDLSERITEALSASSSLIVVCSRNATQSRWVNAEIERFIELGRRHRVFCLLADGEVPAVFPSQLTFEGWEPLAADIRDGKSTRLAYMRLAAAVLDVDLNQLRDRERAYQRNRAFAVTLSVGFGLLVSSLFFTSAAPVAIAITTGIAIYALYLRNRSEELRAWAEHESENAKKESVNAVRRQQQAEGLIDYMLGDLAERLSSIGRLDVMDSVGNRAADYFQSQEDEDQNEFSKEKRGRALRQIGDIRFEQGRLDAALQLYDESLEILRRSIAAEWRESALREIAESLNAVSGVYYARQDLTECTRLVTEFRSLARQLLDLTPDNTVYQKMLVDADNNLGALAFALNDFRTAGSHFTNAERECRKLADADPGDVTSRNRLAGILIWLGNVAEKLKDVAGALSQFRLAIEEQRRIVDADDSPHNREPLSRYLTILSVATRSSDYEESYAAATEAFAITESLVRHDPENTHWRHKRNRANTILIATRLAGNDIKGMQTELDALISDIDAMLLEDEGSLEVSRDRVDAGILCADYWLRSGEAAGAREHASHAVSLARTLLDLNVLDTISVRYYMRAIDKLIDALERCGEPVDAVAREALDVTSGSSLDEFSDEAVKLRALIAGK